MISTNDDKKKLRKNRRKRQNRRNFLIFSLIFIMILSSLIWNRNYLAKYLLENTLDKIVQADISLKSIDINHNGIYFNDLEVESKSDIYYYVKTSNLNIDLNYSSLFNHKLWLKEVVDSLYIESPTIYYKQEFGKSETSVKSKNKSSEEEKENSSSFDVKNYLRKATITNANLGAVVKYSPYFAIKEQFTEAELTFDNKREQNLIANMIDNQQNSFQTRLMLNNNGLNSVAITANGYSPDSLYVPVVENIKTELYGDAILEWSSDRDLYLGLDLISKEASVDLYGMDLKGKNLSIVGDNHNFSVLPESISFMGIPVEVQGNLINLFNTLEIEAKAQVKEYQIANTYGFMNGIINADVEVQGFAKNLHINGIVDSDSLDFNSLAVTNIKTTLDFQEELELNLINAEFDRNKLSGKGVLQKNFISANLMINNKEESAVTLQGNLNTKGIILDGNSYFRLLVSDFMIGYNDILLPPISGLVCLDEDEISGELSNDNIFFKFDSNTLFDNSNASINFLDFHADRAYTALQKDRFAKISPIINGSITINKDFNDLDGNINLEITALNDNIYLPLNTDFSWNLTNNRIDIASKILNGKVYSNKTNLTGEIFISEFNTLDVNVSINDDIVLKGKNLLNEERKARLEINQMAVSELKQFFPEEVVANYPEGYLTLYLNYNWSIKPITGDIYFTNIKAFSLAGYGLESHFEGNLERLFLKELIIYNERQILVTALGSVETTNGIVANVDAVLNEVNFSDYQNIVPLKGYMTAELNFRYDSKDEERYGVRIKGVGSDFKIDKFDINDVYFNVLYSPQKLHVDNLYVNSVNYANLEVIGDFSYDLFRNEFIPSNERLYVKLDADAYRLFQKFNPNLVEEGKIDVRSELIIGIDEEGLQVYEGYIISEDGYLQLVDQPERMNSINISAVMKDNQLDLQRCELNLGDGYLRLTNIISEDNDNFFVGNLILGQLRIFTSQKGLLAHIPEYMPNNETALVKIAGRYQKYATVKGPFDDMKIDAEVTVSNASIIYPPKTENLLSIITSASKNTFKKKEIISAKETVNPLPFELDVKLVVGDNTKYVTYPTDITVTPNSYLTLSYNNSEWTVPDAKFVAEEGTVTFLDTDFDVDLVEILINEIDLSINGVFVKSVQDGSTVTLRVSNAQGSSGGLDNLVLTLESDNPDDKTQAQAMNRLSLSDSNYDMEQEEQNVLQNETIRMLGSNLDNTYVNNFLRPAETFFRKRLRLDYFYIKPGFVKNMVNNYVINSQTDPAQDDSYQEVSDSELAQFGSAILLNNLTINFGRPIYKRLYFNYEGFFQETTNLNRQSNITYDQDFQLRTNIDFKTKMSYTFKYRPSGKSSHEIMLFHSLSF